MIIAWMIYGALAAALLGIAAVAVERAVQFRRGPVRWIWGAALAATTVAMAIAPLRAARSHTADAVRIEVEMASAPTSESYTYTPLPAGTEVPVDAVPTSPARPLSATYLLQMDAGWSSHGPGWIRQMMEPRSARVEILTGYVWVVTSLGLSLLLIVVASHYARARDDWPVADIDGITVHVTPHTGPAVLGFIRPWIAVPEWLLDRPAEEQQMVVDHEAEHLMARDYYLLAAGWMAIALMPWNIVVWWMVMRLRLAIELDCDRRMLRRGLSPHTYGLLLIDVASQYRGLVLGTTGFAHRPSQLERRILAMKPRRGRYPRLRLIGLATAAIAALLFVGWTPIPHLDGATIDRTLSELGPPSETMLPMGRAVGGRGWGSGYELIGGVVNDSLTLQSFARARWAPTVRTLDSVAFIPRYVATVRSGHSAFQLDCVGRGSTELVCVNPVCRQMAGNERWCQAPQPDAPAIRIVDDPAEWSNAPATVPMVNPRQFNGDSTGIVKIDSVRSSADDSHPLLGGVLHLLSGRVVGGDSAVLLSGNREAAKAGVVWLKVSK